MVPAQQTEAFLAERGAGLPPVAARALRQGHRRPQPPPPDRDRRRASSPAAPLAALTGPGFAGEIARGLPTALTLACADPALGRALQAGLATPRLRLYLTDDVDRRRARRGAQERHRHRLRHGRGRPPRRLGPRRADDPRLRRDDPPRRRHGRAARDPRRALGPRRPVADLQLDPVAQLRRRPRARRRRGAARRAPSRGLRPRAPPASLAPATGSSCRSPPPSPTCSRAARRIGEAMDALLSRPLREE